MTLATSEGSPALEHFPGMRISCNCHSENVPALILFYSAIEKDMDLGKKR